VVDYDWLHTSGCVPYSLGETLESLLRVYVRVFPPEYRVYFNRYSYLEYSAKSIVSALCNFV
jgi:hypothetical protein